ncbi:hypothetical protein QQP08_012692 [Theobroma cacao]|nr:hypothetical protein QQP08_012692 [Theobroma cacao]
MPRASVYRQQSSLGLVVQSPTFLPCTCNNQFRAFSIEKNLKTNSVIHENLMSKLLRSRNSLCSNLPSWKGKHLYFVSAQWIRDQLLS